MCVNSNLRLSLSLSLSVSLARNLRLHGGVGACARGCGGACAGDSMHVGAVGWVLRNLVRVGSTRSLVRVGTLAHTRTRSHTHSPTEIAQVGEPIDEHRDAASLEREGVGVSGRVDMGGWVLGGCACGSAHACTCLPRGAARACGGHPSVRRPFRGRHSRTFETRSTRGPNGIPQNYFQSPPRRESGNGKFNPHPRRPACQTVKTLSNFRKRQFSLLSKTSGEAGRTPEPETGIRLL